MSKRHLFTFAVLFIISFVLNSNSVAQFRTEYNLFSVSDNSSLINSTKLKNAVSDALILNLDKSQLKTLCETRSPEIVLEIPYSQNSSAKLILQRLEMLTPDAKIVARTAIGNEEVMLDDIAISYTGKVTGLENSLVSITFSKENVTGMLITESDNFILGSLKDISGNQTDDYILYKESDMKIKNTFFCGTEDNLSSEYIEKMKRIIIENINDSSPTDLYVAEIAIEIDFATYNIFGGSIEAATNYALSLMSASSALYMKEVNVRFVVPYLRVWTTTDPYTGTSSNQLLNQFRAEWNANQQSVQRTLAHFITRRSGNMGGIAWLDVLCSSTAGGLGYGFSNTTGLVQQLPTYTWDVMVVSHEIGHNFGSNHTHSCSWMGGPIDSCYEVEGGCYSGPAIARVGTIMSYCHLNGSISLVNGFGPQPKTLIRSRAESSGCMYISERDLLIGYPNGGESYRTGNTIPVYWGTSLTRNVNLELSTDNGTSWQTIQNNIPATQRTYDWTIPYISTTIQSKIRILNSSNPSVGDTCDGTFKILLDYLAFSLLSPPNLTRVEVSQTNTSIQKFDWSSSGTNSSLRYKFKIRKVGTNVDYSYISENNGADTTISLRKSLLDTLAQALGTTNDSVRCIWRVWTYNGADSASSQNSFFVTLVRTTVGINVISSTIPGKFSLGNNYPNPFNPSTNIKFDIAKSTFAELKVYDSRGSEMKTLVNENLQPGSYEFSFDAFNLPSGVYFYRLKTSEFSETKRMILMK